MRIALPALLALCATAIGAQQRGAPPPGTDIFIATLAKNGRLVVGEPRNVTTRAGYDNQPSFVPDGSAILYSSARGGKPTDIYRLDLVIWKEQQLTDTPEGEYSPTVMPDGKFFSAVRQRGEEQHLWKFPLSGGAGAPLIDRVNRIGYHAWADANTLALFVLGNPPTLQVVDLATQMATTAAENPGRSLHRVPGDGPTRLSFVHKAGEKEWIVRALDTRSRAITTLIRTLPGSEDVAWTPDGVLLTAQDSRLFAWDATAKEAEWREIADLGPAVRRITRIAVSPTNDRIAFVAADRPQP